MTVYTYSDNDRVSVEHFQDLLVADTDNIRNNEDLSAAIPITFTIDLQPDVPRTLTWVFNAHTNITAYTLVFVGTDARGNTITETFNSGWSGETSNAFAVITSIKLTARTGTGATDTMDVGVGSKLGLATRVNTIIKTKRNNTHVANGTISTIYNTVDASTIGAADDYTVWVK